MSPLCRATYEDYPGQSTVSLSEASKNIQL